MDYQQKMLLVCGLLIALALYFALTSAPVPARDTSAAEELLMRAAAFGKGAGDYTYSYSEVSDGYKSTYTLVKNGNDSFAALETPLSYKKVYFYYNDTILCLKETGNETCGSVAGLPQLDNYIAFFRSRFFSDSVIDRDKNNLKYMVERGYAKLSPDIADSSSSGRPCSRISYTINFTNLSIDEAARFGIGSSAPREFLWTMCVDNQTGIPYEKAFNYTFNGTLHTYRYTLAAYKDSASAIVRPENISTGQTNGILDKLYKGREQEIKLASCYTDTQGEDRERCIAVMALDIKRKDLCELAGARRDRCLVSLVPEIKDPALCPAVGDPSFRDDCYIELAGALKDKTYCDYITDATKKQKCMEVSAPGQAKPSENTTNKTSTFDPLKFMQDIDKYGENKTNSTTPANSS
ncbi:MAG TPA: hypothetical protein VLD37_05920 [Candidatus Bilamarchaeum sp.]|nr:hypothetical protein [Candidatus Bilamarchaeum sp.]